MPPAECPDGACLVIRAYEDRDRDGRHDPGEPMIEGIGYKLTSARSAYSRSTGADGTVWLCFPDPLDVSLEELSRVAGGRWYITSRERRGWHVDCGTTEVLLGHAPIGVPRTGTRGSGPGWRSAAGPNLYD
jgi:hypothetical protein